MAIRRAMTYSSSWIWSFMASLLVFLLVFEGIHIPEVITSRPAAVRAILYNRLCNLTIKVEKS